MSNPNPVKQVRHSGDAMTARMKAKFKVYVPRVRAPGEALPNTISAMGADNIYRPQTVGAARAGADDHLAIPSRSFAGVSYPAHRHARDCLDLGVCQGKACANCEHVAPSRILL